MATRCIDVKEDSRFKSTSPIAIAAWLVSFIIINLTVSLGLMWIVINLAAFLFTHIFFQFEARYIYLTYLFMILHTDLSPNFRDPKYVDDETKYPELKRVLKDDYIASKKAQLKHRDEAYERHLVYLKSLKARK